MSDFNLVTIAATDYQDSGTYFPGVPSQSITLVVTAGACYVQFAPIDASLQLRPTAAQFESREHYLMPAIWNYTGVDFNDRKVAGVRVRAALAGFPSVVTILA